MKIDLWTKEMPVDEMKRFYVDTMGAMAESIITATNDSMMATKMRNLCKELTDHLNAEEGQQS
jgi:gliding motility-associated protein GldC